VLVQVVAGVDRLVVREEFGHQVEQDSVSCRPRPPRIVVVVVVVVQLEMLAVVVVLVVVLLGL
jgi:hypothetical protein